MNRLQVASCIVATSFIGVLGAGSAERQTPLDLTAWDGKTKST